MEGGGCICLVSKGNLNHEPPVCWVSEASPSCWIESSSVSCAAAAAETACVRSSVAAGAGASAGSSASLSAFGRSGAFLISRTSPASGDSWPSSCCFSDQEKASDRLTATKLLGSLTVWNLARSVSMTCFQSQCGVRVLLCAQLMQCLLSSWTSNGS